MSENYKTKKLSRNILILFVSMLILLFVSLGVYILNSNKEKQNDKNLIGYTLKEEILVDTCKLVNVEGFYLGKGILNGEEHYIFQVEKDNKFSNNIDITNKSIEIIYLPKDDSKNIENKIGTIKAYSRIYEKKDKNGKIAKTQTSYFYKAYIPENGIKDCGTLTDKNSNEEDSE